MQRKRYRIPTADSDPYRFEDAPPDDFVPTGWQYVAGLQVIHELAEKGFDHNDRIGILRSALQMEASEHARRPADG